jgi:hypothetical protein
MEVDRAIMLWLTRPGVLLAGPVPALHASRRQIAEHAIAAIGADVHGDRRIDSLREVPMRNEVLAELHVMRPRQEPIMK